MKLEGYRRLEAHVPTDLWDEIEKARGQMTRSEFTRQALRAQLDYPSMLAAPKTPSGVTYVNTGGVNGGSTPPPDVVIADFTNGQAEPDLPAKSAREILLERTRLMRGNNS